MKIRVKEKCINGIKGYDIEVLDDSVTVADYLNAMNCFIEKAGIDRLRQSHSSQESKCLACNDCCQERIPLTWIDVVKLSVVIPLEELFKKYIGIFVSGKAVDMTLKLNPLGSCPFNAPENQLCSHYGVRPFVCQTYICCPTSLRARLLREAIVNAGEDQLVREWLQMVQREEIDFRIDEADDFDLDEEDWLPTAYEGKKAYDQVLLKELCSQELWDRIKGVV